MIVLGCLVLLVVLLVGIYISIVAYIWEEGSKIFPPPPPAKPISLMLDEDDIPTEEIVFHVRGDDEGVLLDKTFRN